MLDLLVSLILVVSNPDPDLTEPFAFDPWYTCVDVGSGEWDCATAADTEVHLQGTVTYFGPGSQIQFAYDATHPNQ